MKVGFAESKEQSLWDHLKSVPKLQVRYNGFRTGNIERKCELETQVREN